MSTVTSYKGFDKNLKCRGFQFEIGKTYKHEGKIKVCESGFHASLNILNVFLYYSPASSRFCIVEQSGKIDKRDKKICSSEIKIVKELSFDELITIQIEQIQKNAKQYRTESNSGDRSVASANGENSIALSAGTQAKASASEGSWIVLAEMDGRGNISLVKAAKAGDDIKPDVLYTLKGGSFKACEE